MFENRFLFDWLTFSSQIHTPAQIAGLLGISFDRFTYCNYGFLTFPVHYRLDNIVIACDPLRPDRGVCCNMSGSGCRAFEKYGHGDFEKIFKIILENYSDDTSKRNMNVSRLDVAHDVFDGSLDILSCYNYMTADLREDVRRFINPDYTNNNVPCGNFITRCKRDLCVSHKNCASAVECTFGSQKSNLFVRIYDKQKEQASKDINYFVDDFGEVHDFSELEHGWIRNEIMLRDKNAISFIRKLYTENDVDTFTITELFYGLINNTFRFVEPSSDNNIRRWDIAPFWAVYLNGMLEKISILPASAPEVYTKEKNTKYISNQVKNALATYIDLNGVYALIKMLKENRDDKPKYTALINEYGLSDQNVDSFFDKMESINNLFYDDDIMKYFEEI